MLETRMVRGRVDEFRTCELAYAAQSLKGIGVYDGPFGSIDLYVAMNRVLDETPYFPGQAYQDRVLRRKMLLTSLQA